MEALIWSGAAVSLLGLAGLVWCIVTVMRARRAKLDEEEMRARLARVLPMNMAALFLSVIGLMMVVVGILLG
jgi:heme exporter protein D